MPRRGALWSSVGLADTTRCFIEKKWFNSNSRASLEPASLCVSIGVGRGGHTDLHLLRL